MRHQREHLHPRCLSRLKPIDPAQLRNANYGWCLTAPLGNDPRSCRFWCLVPQVLRAWRTKQTKDLSVRTFLMLITAGVLWLTYGVLASDWPVIATNAGMVVLNGAILGAKLRYK